MKNLINRNKTFLEKMSVSKENRESLARDLEGIQKYCARNLTGYNYAGLAIFSCSKKNFWQEFNLGTHELEAGEHRLTVEITGSNPKAAKRHMFGVDYLKLDPVE